MQLDHLILPVNDLPTSVQFFTDILGLARDGETGPFTIIRITNDLTLQLAPWGTTGGEHLAFAMTRKEFDSTFERIRNTHTPYGDSFHTVRNMHGPGREDGARGSVGATRGSLRSG